jgi:transcriptional regulator with XRE-family HTH domain
MMTFSEIVQARIKTLRKAAKLTQQEFGDKVGVGRVIITRWETGESRPSPENMDAIAKSLNVPVWELCTPTEELQRSKSCDIESAYIQVMEYTRDKILADLQMLGKKPTRDLLPFDSKSTG